MVNKKPRSSLRYIFSFTGPITTRLHALPFFSLSFFFFFFAAVTRHLEEQQYRLLLLLPLSGYKLTYSKQLSRVSELLSTREAGRQAGRAGRLLRLLRAE